MSFSTAARQRVAEAAGGADRIAEDADGASLVARPRTDEGVAALLALATSEGFTVRTRPAPPGAAGSPRPALRIDVREMREIVEHSAADETVTARCGTRLLDLQEAVRSAGQWLPMDPIGDPGTTIGAIVAGNEWGPLRTGHGTIREHLLGSTFAMADGRVLRTGGLVVKSATGYDLHRLQVGAEETLALGLRFTLRLRPRPASSGTWLADAATRGEAIATALAIRGLQDPPAALLVRARRDGSIGVVAHYLGRAEAVARAVERARAARGGRAASDVEGEAALADARREPVVGDGIALRVGCRPSRLAACVEAALEALAPPAGALEATLHPALAFADLALPRGGRDPAECLGAAGDAVAPLGAHVRLRSPWRTAGFPASSAASPAVALMERLRRSADPAGILNPGILLPQPSLSPSAP